MFHHTKLRLIGKDGDFEVLNSETGEVVGAIIREAGSEKDWEKSGGGLPYQIFYKGVKIATSGSLPLSQKTIDDLVNPGSRQ